MGKCAIINGKCPKTNDQNEKRYCPHWVDGIPEVEKDGTGRVVAESIFRGCFLTRAPLYMVGMTAAHGQTAAAYNDARNVVVESLGAGEQPVTRALVELGVLALAGRSRAEGGGGDDDGGEDQAMLDPGADSGATEA